MHITVHLNILGFAEVGELKIPLGTWVACLFWCVAFFPVEKSEGSLSHSGFIENHHGNQSPAQTLPWFGYMSGDKGGDGEETWRRQGGESWEGRGDGRSRGSMLEIQAEKGGPL